MNKKKVYLIGFCAFMVLTLVFLYINVDLNILNHSSSISEEQYGPEEKPELIISPEEQAINKRYQDRFLKLHTNLKSTSERSVIANGKLTGTWSQFKFLTSDLYQGYLGFRVDGSLYDKENDVIYAVSYAGHLYRIDRGATKDDTDWVLLNHKNNFLWKYYGGLNKADGSFRMIRSTPEGMEYSDNEGRDWIKVEGLSTVESSNEGVIVNTGTGNKVFVLLKTSSTNYQVYASVDDGVTYSSLPTTFNPSQYVLKMFKAHNSESAFIAAYSKSTSKVSIYEHTVDGSGFDLINTSSGSILEPNGNSHVSATLVDGTYHFYIGSTNKDFYYSNDKGASWSHTSVAPEANYGHYNLREVHPTKPNLVHRGFLDINHSDDYGKTWQGIKHHIGWDVQHSNYYQRKDGTFFLFVGNDMGCFINDTPDVKEGYIPLNNGSPSQMCYDVDHGQHTNTSFSAMQDRGNTGYNTETKISNSHSIATTDALRAELSYNETSIWTWLYYGSINRRENFLFGSAPAVGIGGKGNWWAANMVAFPNPKEDAMILAYGNKLTKLSYNPAYIKVVETQHHFDFNKISGSKITGFGYSTVNTKRWYVSLENRDFYYSVDGGQTFEKSTYSGYRPYSQSNWHKYQHVIKASKKDEQTVYWAGKGNTFLISKDGGKTFTNHINGLDVARITDFDVSPDDKFIFASCMGAGAWVYSADDDQWYPIIDPAIPSSGINFTDAEFIDKKNEIRFGSYGSGILSFTIEGQSQLINYPDVLSAELAGDKTIVLQWQDNSSNEEGFIIERSMNGEFLELARVDANQTTFTDSDIPGKGKYLYRLKAYNATDVSYASNYAMAEVKAGGLIDKSGWTLVSVDSEDLVNPQLATYAFDDNEGTFWFTQWSGAQPSDPHEIVINLNENVKFIGFNYLPRQDGKDNGIIKDYEFYISMDNITWIKVSEGALGGSKNAQQAYFNSQKEARYIKLVALSCASGTNFTGCAELDLLTSKLEDKAPNAPVVIKAGLVSDTEIELAWLDMSKDEQGFIVEEYVDGAFKVVHTSAEDATGVTFPGVSKDKTYWYRIYAFNEIGNSAYSDTITVGSEEFPKNSGVYDIVNREDIKIYPNPFQTELNISYTVSNLFTNWRLLDMSGRVINQGSMDAYQTQVTLQGLNMAPGTYIVQLKGEHGSISKKVIKKL